MKLQWLNQMTRPEPARRAANGALYCHLGNRVGYSMQYKNDNVS